MAKETKKPGGERKPTRDSGYERPGRDIRKKEGGLKEERERWPDHRINKVTDWDKPRPPKKD